MYDFIIVGSGVSGGRIAYELTTAGAKCLLLEAGQEFTRSTFPNNELDYTAQMFWNCGLETNMAGTIGFLRAKCVGGTSIVNQALLDRFDDLAWDDWRDRSGISFFNTKDMEAHYQACEKTIKISSIPPEHYNKNTRIFIKGFESLGYKWKKLDRGQDDCKLDHGTDCIVCLGGCPRDSKQSSLVTAIRRARELGLESHSNFEVYNLIDHNTHVEIRGTHQGQEKRIQGRRIFLAGGVFGNAAILLRSGFAQKLPALGKNFSCHPQYMTYARFAEPVDSHKGAFQGVKSADPKIRKAGFKFENVFAPPIGTSMLVPHYGPAHMKTMNKYRYLASMEVAVRDEPTGTVSINRSGKLMVQKNLTSQDKHRVQEGLGLIEQFFRAAGAAEVINCTQGFGLHLMGGCVIGVDAKSSVVDPEFKVHNHPNIFIGDSSVFPSAPGINPSFSIMALSHRAALSASSTRS